MYNIFTTLNSGYYKFGQIFINSLYKNLNLNKINKIYIADTGLDLDHKKYFLSFDKVKIIDTNTFTKDTSLWSKDWLDNVSSKTKTLKQICISEDLPTIMVDVDCMFVKDFFNLIDLNYDLQVCYRENSNIPYLGSFVSVNSKNAILFIERWIESINNWKGTPKESPALSKMVEQYKNKFKIKNMLDKKISCYCDSNEMIEWGAYIVHFKSRKKFSTFEEDFNDRVSVRGFDKYTKNYLK